MLSTWLTELYLNELGNLNDERNMEAYLRLQKEFHDFLDRPELKVYFTIFVFEYFMHACMQYMYL